MPKLRGKALSGWPRSSDGIFAVAMTLLLLERFSTRLLIDFHSSCNALLAYGANILLLGAVLFFSWGYATRTGLVKGDIAPGVPAAICRPILIAQSLAFGALCVVNTYWSSGLSRSCNSILQSVWSGEGEI